MKYLIILLCFLLAGCGVVLADVKTGDELYASAMDAFDDQNYEKAAALFNQSSLAYRETGDTAGAHRAFLKEKQIAWIFLEMGLNETTARKVLTTIFPAFTPDEIERLLTPEASIQFESDGETRYFNSLANNVAYHNLSIIRSQFEKAGHSPFFDEIYPLTAAEPSFEGPYGNPHTFSAESAVTFPRSLLPENGTLKVWIPLPVETESQRNITVLSVEPAAYVKNGPITTGDLGMVYLEIPLEDVTGEWLNITADYRFTTSERRFEIDPGLVGEYDTGSDLYSTYTRSQENIELTPEIAALAEQIVGDETNPYRKAELIYRYIITTYPYSLTPHTHLTALGTPESTFMYETGFGDCGTQSMLFSALCRSTGIPARAAGGYQLAPGLAGTHFWAEFYLPAYGWIPVDVTIAESSDWSWNATEAERDTFKGYYFGNLDPYRLTMQNDVDVPFSPKPGEDAILNMVHQTPTVVCEGVNEDLELLGMEYWTITLSDVS